MRTELHLWNKAGGFVLLEIILALALFAMVATSMTVAIHQMADASRSSRDEGRVLRKLESVIAEVTHRDELGPQVLTLPAGDDGVAAEAVITEADLRTMQKARLDRIYLITADAWVEDGASRRMKRHLETYAYAPKQPKA